MQNKAREKQYAFVPLKTEAELLRSFKDDTSFKNITSLVPHYRFIDIIRTGLLIKHYHENDSAENRMRVDKIKKSLIKRPKGRTLLKIANLPTTPFFYTILELMNDFKRQGFSESVLEENFDMIVERWEESSLMVKKTDSLDDVLWFCENQALSNRDFFIICGMRSASRLVENAYDKFEKDGFLAIRGYMGQLTKSRVGNHPRTEVLYVKSESR